MRKHRFLKGLRIVLFASLAAAAASFVVMSLWNSLMPDIFAVRAISFWQALGLLVLSRLLFGGLRPHTGLRSRWRQRMLERWQQMTPEEREKFRQGLHGRCGRRVASEAPSGEAGIPA